MIKMRKGEVIVLIDEKDIKKKEAFEKHGFIWINKPKKKEEKGEE